MPGIVDQSRFAGLNSTFLWAHAILAPWVTTSATRVSSVACSGRPHGDDGLGMLVFRVTASSPVTCCVATTDWPWKTSHSSVSGLPEECLLSWPGLGPSLISPCSHELDCPLSRWSPAFVYIGGGVGLREQQMSRAPGTRAS